jgi:hypothetical protein
MKQPYLKHRSMTRLAFTLVFLLLLPSVAKAKDFSGTYTGYYKYFFERIVVNGKSRAGGTLTGVNVEARVNKNGGITLELQGELLFNGRPTGEYFDEVWRGRVSPNGSVRLSKSGWSADAIKELFGNTKTLRKSSSIRGNRLELRLTLDSSKMGRVDYQLVATK